MLCSEISRQWAVMVAHQTGSRGCQAMRHHCFSRWPSWSWQMPKRKKCRNLHRLHCVPAGGLTGTGKVPLVGKRRLDVASELHHHHGQSCQWHSCLLGAGDSAAQQRSQSASRTQHCAHRASLGLAAGRNIPILCSGGGTPHVPAVLGPTGHVIHESTAYAHYLATEQDVPASCILKETSSYDTIGNAYFSIKTHVLPAGWR